MKKIFVLGLVAISIGLPFENLMADDSFIVTRDGKDYLCKPVINPNPGGAIDCIDKAYNGPFSRDESMALCEGARGVGPAECAIMAYAGPFSRIESLALCKKNGTIANAECAIKAYQGIYTREEALRLCKADPLAILRTLSFFDKLGVTSILK